MIKPVEFPGGNIGKLAVCGTVNDLAVMGAEPLYLSAGFILEEGLPLDLLTRIVTSMAATAKRRGVQVVTGDTKVVPRGECDGLFINTAGIGRLPCGMGLCAEPVRTVTRFWSPAPSAIMAWRFSPRAKGWRFRRTSTATARR